MSTILIFCYFSCPILISLVPGILREDHYPPVINDVISILCVFFGAILCGLYLPHPGADDYASVTRQLIISLVMVITPARLELVSYLQTHVHLYIFQGKPHEDTH